VIEGVLIMRHVSYLLPLLVAGFAACSDNDKGGSGSGATDRNGAAADAAPGHGVATDLGTLSVGGREFSVTLLGEMTPGVEGAFEVHPVGMDMAEVSKLNTYLWVESEGGTQLSAPAKGGVEAGALHFHATPRAGEEQPFRVVLRLRSDGLDERASLPLDGHGHEHRDGPHHGIPARFSGGGTTGHLELKLHDDKGDLELWLANDPDISDPFDLPVGATVEIEFVDVGGRKVALRPRNTLANEDEGGNPNVRDGKTHYFIYPGQGGEDASWLRGSEFQSIVIVRFSRAGTSYSSEEFVLKPHAH